MKIEAPATIPEASQAIDAVKAAVAREFGITLDDINSQSRREPLPMIRHIGMALCHELVEYVTLLSITRPSCTRLRRRRSGARSPCLSPLESRK